MKAVGKSSGIYVFKERFYFVHTRRRSAVKRQKMETMNIFFVLGAELVDGYVFRKQLFFKEFGLTAAEFVVKGVDQ